VAIGGIGAPVVSSERIKEGKEGLRSLRALEAHLGIRADAVVCEEIGGANAIEPLIVAAMAGLPVVDCDGMGRAFPEMQMTTYSIYGHQSTPAAMCDPHGNVVLFAHAISETWFERMARACVVSQGGSSVLANAPMTGAFLKMHAIPHSYSKAIALGNAVLSARQSGADPAAAICQSEGGRIGFRGKIIDVQRQIAGGFLKGEVLLTGFDECEGERASVQFQNEYLVFSRGGVPEAVVPDLIVILDPEKGTAISTDQLRYGQRVNVLALPAHPLLTTPEALRVVGPTGFGLDGIAWRSFHGTPEVPT
jgi:hypothetical protein